MSLTGESNTTNTVSGSASALNADAIPSYDVSYAESLFLQIAGTFSATVTFQGSNDETNWFAIRGTNLSSEATSGQSAVTVPGLYLIPAAFKHFRARLTAYASGTVSAVLVASENSTPTILANQTQLIQYANGNIAGITPQNRLKVESTIADGQQVDAYGTLRVSPKQSIFDCTFPNDKQLLIFSELTATGGTVTHSVQTASVQVNTTTASGSSAFFQSRRYFKYFPGKSHLIQLSGNLGGLKANTRRRIGYFDAEDGIFFEVNGLTINVVIRTSTSGSPVDTAIPQSSWNLDKLDGTGASGATLDISKSQLFIIDFQWQGTGRVRFGFNLNGTVVYCHQVQNANVRSLPYMRTPNLPIRIENVNTGTVASNTTATITCATVIIEGQYSPEGIVRATSNGNTTRSVSGTFVPVLSIRKQAAFVHVPIRFNDYSFFANTADDFEVQILINPTITGASWTNLPGVAQVDVSGTAVTGGTVVYSTYVRGSAGSGSSAPKFDGIQSDNFNLGSDLAGNSDIFTIAVRSLTGSSNCLASLIYRELI